MQVFGSSDPTWLSYAKVLGPTLGTLLAGLVAGAISILTTMHILRAQGRREELKLQQDQTLATARLVHEREMVRGDLYRAKAETMLAIVHDRVSYIDQLDRRAFDACTAFIEEGVPPGEDDEATSKFHELRALSELYFPNATEQCTSVLHRYKELVEAFREAQVDCVRNSEEWEAAHHIQVPFGNFTDKKKEHFSQASTELVQTISELAKNYLP